MNLFFTKNFSAFVLLFLSAVIFPIQQKDKFIEDFSEYSQQIPGTDEAIEMVPITGEIFTMGSPENEKGRNSDEGPQYRVKVNSFWMGKFEITWDQYDLFVRENADILAESIPVSGANVELTADAVSLPTPPYMDMSFGMGRVGYPAINMTHYAAVSYAKWLTAKTGRFYRLPTEAEWEYACRAGSDTAYHFGDDPSKLENYGWFYENSDRAYQKVGIKKPNEFGLYDMHGNVTEWVMDQYNENYYSNFEGDVAENPWLRPTELYPRVVRGGSWKDDSDQVRCASRRGSRAEWKQRDPQLPKSLWWHTDADFVGFRLVRPKDQPSHEEMEQYWIDAMEDF